MVGVGVRISIFSVRASLGASVPLESLSTSVAAEIKMEMFVGACVVGAAVARNESVHVGSEVTLLGLFVVFENVSDGVVGAIVVKSVTFVGGLVIFASVGGIVRLFAGVARTVGLSFDGGLVRFVGAGGNVGEPVITGSVGLVVVGRIVGALVVTDTVGGAVGLVSGGAAPNHVHPVYKLHSFSNSKALHGVAVPSHPV